ncbi:N-acetylgalactosamine-6-sulfatase [Dermatophagoides farinae]|uniref:N-acetylgalactosamine-6-sulfatase n=1 Tax=Dermatophagoides farinae TaxID=6954 RepID=UPI003F5E9CB3
MMMMMKMDRKSIFFSILFTIILTNSHGKKCDYSKPNIVIMLMDDMGWGDLGVNGDPSRETPYLDRLAAEGMQFTDFYAGSPLCSPSRAALLTGRLPIRNGFYTTNIHARNSYIPQEMVGGISRSEILISELLAKTNYRNKIIGKWHLGHSKSEYYPWNRGFHEFFGSFGIHSNPHDNVKMPNVPLFRNDKMIGRYYENILIDRKNQQSDILKNFTQEAIEFIQQESAKGNPFFLYWTPDTLHAPTYRSAEFVGRSMKNSSYGDALIQMDHSIQAIIETIRNEPCLQNNTFVFFTSDNGPALTSRADAGRNGPFLCGKQTTFEGGFREPAIAWWPTKIAPGTINRHISTHMDLFLTIATIAQISVPDDRHYDSNDLTKVMFNSSHENQNASMFYYRGDTLMAIRHGSYKAHYWTFSTPPEELRVGINFCPGQNVVNLTTSQLTNHTELPLLFHLYRDPAERFAINPKTKEYKENIKILNKIRDEHQRQLKPGKPELNYCDQAVMSWSPPGCETINMCLPIPKSSPYLCEWPH